MVFEFLMIFLLILAYIGLIPFSYFMEEINNAYTIKSTLKSIVWILISTFIIGLLCYGSILCHIYISR